MKLNNKNQNHPIKITIVAHGLRAGGGVSVGKNLINGLTSTIQTANYQIFVPKGLDYQRSVDPSIKCSWIEYEHKYGLAGRWFYDKTQLIHRIESFSPDIVICLGNIGISKKICPQVLLTHDPHLFYPSNHYSREGLVKLFIYHLRRLRFASDLKKTNILLCQTNTAKNRIAQRYSFKEEMQLLPNAISVESLSGNSAEGIKLPGTRKNAFNIFYLTRYYPHKNIEIFFDLFVKYRDQLKDVVLYLTIDKKQHPLAEKLLKSISDNHLTDNIVNIGPIQQKDIASHFKSMHAMVMPTTLESFSGSYIEAMAFGCPILTSDLDFAHEVCEDAALYFDPWSTDSLYNTLRKIIDDPALAKTLVNRGTQIFNKKSPTWKQNSELLASTILRLVGRTELNK